MAKALKAWLSLLAALATVSGAEAAGTVEREYPVPGHRVLRLMVPEAWASSLDQPPGGLPPTIRLAPPAGEDFMVQITPLWHPRGDPGFTSPENLKKLAEAARDRLRAAARESSIELREIRGPSATGLYFSVTDKTSNLDQPEPGDYPFNTFGVVAVGDLVLTCTILTKARETPVVESALDVLRTAAVGRPQAPSTEPYEIGLPGAGWSLLLDLPGFSIQMEEARPDGSGRMMQAMNQATGVTVAVFVERESGLSSAKECRDFNWKETQKFPVKMSKIRLWEKGHFSFAEYTIKTFQGVQIEQKNLRASLFREGICIEVHLSKVHFNPSHETLFSRILSSARFQTAG